MTATSLPASAGPAAPEAPGWRGWLPDPLEIAYLGVGCWLALRYFWILDDAFVYFRYADNWLFLDAGLTFNAGEYVEGYTSPLWLLLLSVLRLSEVDFPALVSLLSLVCFVPFALLLVRLNRLLAPPGAPAVNVPLAYLGLSYGVLSYFSSGVETPLVQITAVGIALHLLRPGALGLELLLAASPLVRPDLALPLGLVWLWTWWRSRAVPWRLLALAVVLNGAWLVFRAGYYADLLPNTFYVKDAVLWGQGLAYVKDTVLPYGLLYLLAGAVAAALILRSRDDGPTHVAERMAMVAIALCFLVYVVRIGGDARHFRFMAFPFCLLVCATGGLLEGVLGRLERPWRLALTGLAGFAIAAGSASAHPRQLNRHPLNAKVVHRKVANINDAMHHRQWRVVVGYRDWIGELEPERLRAQRDAVHGEAYWRRLGVELCAPAYRAMDRAMMVGPGLTNSFLSHIEVPHERPGHKPLLAPYRADLAALYRSGIPVGRGMLREAVERGMAPAWVGENLETLELLEKKTYNRQDFAENLRLALRFPGKIRPDGGTPR